MFPSLTSTFAKLRLRRFKSSSFVSVTRHANPQKKPFVTWNRPRDILRRSSRPFPVPIPPLSFILPQLLLLQPQQVGPGCRSRLIPCRACSSSRTPTRPRLRMCRCSPSRKSRLHRAPSAIDTGQLILFTSLFVRPFAIWRISFLSNPEYSSHTLSFSIDWL